MLERYRQRYNSYKIQFCKLKDSGTDLFLTEERVERVRFLWGKRGEGAGEGAGGGAGGDVRGRRPPAAAAPAASSTNIHNLDITRPCARDARITNVVTPGAHSVL